MSLPTATQSGLVAGGDVDVNVGGHTQLDGAVVASTGGDVTLETETFGYSDIRDHDDYRNVSGSISGSLSLGDLFGDEDASAESDRRGSTGNAVLDTIAKLPTVEGGYEAGERDQTTRATVAAPNGDATIVIRANPDQGLEGLNTALEKAQEVTQDKSTKVKTYSAAKASRRWPAVSARPEKRSPSLPRPSGLKSGPSPVRWIAAGADPSPGTGP